MKRENDVKKFFNNAAIDSNPKMDEAVLNKVLRAHEKAKNTQNIRSIIMESPITKIAAALVLVAGICMTILSGKSAWAQVIEAFNKATDVHIVKVDVAANGVAVTASEAWIKNQTLFRAETQDWRVVDNGRNVLTLYKNDKIAHIRESFTPYWDYTPLILKVFHDSQSRTGIDVTRLPEQCTATMDVYDIDCRDYWQGKAWVDPTTNLPLKISGREKGYDGRQKDFELSFDYEGIAEEIFSISIPADYQELPRIVSREPSEERNEVLFGTVVDEQGNPVANALVCASYAHYGHTDQNGQFALLISPVDGSGSLGPADFPMFVWASKGGDPYRVAWTLIRHPQAAEFRALGERMLRPTIDTGQEQEQTGERFRVEETHQGVKLAIESESDLSRSIPGNPGELYNEPDDDIKVRNIVLIMGPASIITGRVTDTTGRPIANAVVQLEMIELQLGVNTITVSELNDEWKGQIIAITDNGGHYILGNLPACWRKAHVTARSDNYRRSERLLANAGQNTASDFQLTEGQSEDARQTDDEHFSSIYRPTGRPRRDLRPEPQEFSDQSNHFEQVIAHGHPVKGGGNVVTELVPANLCRNLVLYYSFDAADGRADVLDISGRNRHAQNHKAAYVQANILGRAMEFDGDNDYLTVPDIALEQFTFSAWVMPRTDHLNNRLIFMLTDGSRYCTLQGNAGESVGVCIADAGEINEYDWSLAQELWTHLTVTYDRETFCIYRNGTLTEAGDKSTGPIAGTVYIGGSTYDEESSWQGLLDEVALFDRALNPEEVVQLFAMTGAVVQDR